MMGIIRKILLKNIIEKYSQYKKCKNINVFSDDNNEKKTFEICLYENNIDYIKSKNITTSKDTQKFMLNNKSENAYRILKELEKENGEEGFRIPDYIVRAIKWIKD